MPNILNSTAKVLLRDSVVVISVLNGDTLRTSELWWDQNKQEFYTTAPARIHQRAQTLHAQQGLRAAQNLSWKGVLPGLRTFPDLRFHPHALTWIVVACCCPVRSMQDTYILYFYPSNSFSMEYRKLGRSGLQLSVLSFGSWVTFHKQVDDSIADELMGIAYDNGINFFDNAEVYALGESEKMMGRVLKKKQWDRTSYVVSSKAFFGWRGKTNRPNQTGLSRKHLFEACNEALQRLSAGLPRPLFLPPARCYRTH